MSKERRKHFRITVSAEKCQWFGTSEFMRYDAEVVNISPGGAFIKSTKFPDMKAPVHVSLNLPGDCGDIVMDAKVIWRRWAAKKNSTLPVGFAVEFNFEDNKMQKVMEAFCIYLRNKQIINISKRIMDEFFPTDEVTI